MHDATSKAVRTRPRRGASVLALVAAASLALPASVHADCSDSAPFMSKEYLFNKGDCAVDKAIDAGTGALVDMGKNLLKAGLDAYLPGISSLLFGGGDDPFAAHAREILDAIDRSRKEILGEIIHQVRLEDTIQLERLQTRIQSWQTLSTPLKKTDLGQIETLVNDLHDLRLSFQSTNYDVWNLHAYIVVVDMLLSMEASRIAIHGSIANWSGYTQEQAAAAVAQDIYEAWDAILSPDSSTGVFNYIAGFKSAHFDELSAARFSGLRYASSFISTDPRCKSSTVYTGLYNLADSTPDAGLPTTSASYYAPVVYMDQCAASGYAGVLWGYLLKAATPNPTDPTAVKTAALWSLPLGSSTVSPPVVVSNNPPSNPNAPPSNPNAPPSNPNAPPSNPNAPPSSSTSPPPNQTVLWPYYSFSGAQSGVDRVLAAHKAREAASYFMASYGSVRPMLDRWWDQMHYGPLPARVVDTRVDSAIDQISGYGFALMSLPSVLSDPQNIDPDGVRWAKNYVIALGYDALSRDIEAVALDPFIGTAGVPFEHFRQAFRELRSPEDVEAAYRAQFAAKLSALM